MTNAQYKIVATLRSGELENAWQEALGWTPGLDSEKQSEGIKWIRGQRDAFIDCVAGVGDEFDQKMMIAVRYIELKCSWTQMNTLNNYIMVQGVDPDPYMVMKSGLLSQMLGNLEALLEPDDLENITNFINQPIQELM